MLETTVKASVTSLAPTIGLGPEHIAEDVVSFAHGVRPSALAAAPAKAAFAGPSRLPSARSTSHSEVGRGLRYR